jgi:hypothetical protein
MKRAKESMKRQERQAYDGVDGGGPAGAGSSAGSSAGSGAASGAASGVPEDEHESLLSMLMNMKRKLQAELEAELEDVANDYYEKEVEELTAPLSLKNRRDAVAHAVAMWKAFCKKIKAMRDEVSLQGFESLHTLKDVAKKYARRLDKIFRRLFREPNDAEVKARDLAGVEDPVLHTMKRMRQWADDQAAKICEAAADIKPPHTDAINNNWTVRILAAYFVEEKTMLNPRLITSLFSILTVGHPMLINKNPLRKPMPYYACKLPYWSTAIVGGATMDPYLGLKRLVGPVTYMYLEPKPEWRARCPYLPILVLLGDRHEVKPPCAGFDLTNAFTKEVGGSHSFFRYLDSHRDYSRMKPDVMVESWQPKHLRTSSSARPDIYRHSTSGGGPLHETITQLIWDCIGPHKAESCTLVHTRVHVADVRHLYKEDQQGYAHLLLNLLESMNDSNPMAFLEKCAAACPGWEPQALVRSLFSGDIFEDLDNARLRRERVAHEFYQLDLDIQAEFRARMAYVEVPPLSYDLASAVNEWLTNAEEAPCQIHPWVMWDVQNFINDMSTKPRRAGAVELYALSRLMKRGTPSRLGVLCLGANHCSRASYLLQNMYNIHGAAECVDGDKCIDFDFPSNTLFDEDKVRHPPYLTKRDAYVLKPPSKPIVW